jgi:hypothetical protein
MRYADPLLPGIDSMHVNVDFPCPGEDRKHQQRDRIIPRTHRRQQPMHRPSRDGDKRPRPDHHPRQRRQHRPHRLNINAGQQIPSRKPRKAGRHPATGARQPRALQKRALRQSQLPMRPQPVGVWCQSRRRDQKPQTHSRQRPGKQPAPPRDARQRAFSSINCWNDSLQRLPL